MPSGTTVSLPMLALFKLALRNVGRHKRRTLLTLASIVFGVVAMILSGGFIEDTIVEVGESMIHSYSGHLQVSRKGYSTYGSQSPEKYLIDKPEDLRKTLAAAPGVDDILLRISFSGLLGNGRSDWSIVGEGVEPEREAKLGSYVTLAAGRQLKAGDAFGMMVGHGVARSLKLKPGDQVSLMVSTAGGAANLLDFEVVGIFQTFSKDYDARAVRIPLSAAQELLATAGAHTAVVSLKETRFTDPAAADLRQRLSAEEFELKTWVDLNEFYTQTVTLYEQQFGFLVIIILIMLLLSVSNTVNMSVFERVAEFGTMLAIGDTSQRVFRLIGEILPGAVVDRRRRSRLPGTRRLSLRLSGSRPERSRKQHAGQHEFDGNTGHAKQHRRRNRSIRTGRLYGWAGFARSNRTVPDSRSSPQSPEPGWPAPDGLHCLAVHNLPFQDSCDLATVLKRETYESQNSSPVP